MCLCVHWCTVLNSFPLPPPPPPPQMTSILSEQLCTLADGCLVAPFGYCLDPLSAPIGEFHVGSMWLSCQTLGVV